MKKKKTKHKNFDQFVNEQLTKDPELADELLEHALKEYQKDGDEKTLLIALKQVTLAKCGFQELSNKTGLSRESLYKTLSDQGNPRLTTLKKILEALNYRIYFQHV
ncbi:MAG: putative addiction module antidote protein [Rickettsiales bacterium]|nr:putative addiction module antidote protein [Rickettsiales bacterium]